MARIAGVDIPPQKRTIISLMYITGIGRTTAEKIVKMANINPDIRVKDLSDEDVTRLRQIIDRMATAKEILIEGDLGRDEHQAHDRDRLVPGRPSPPWSAGARTAHPHQRAQPPRPEACSGREEEGQSR